VAPSDAAQASASDPVVSTVFSLVRWLSYAGLVLLVGPLVIAGVCWSAVLRVPGVSRLFRLGVWISIGAAVLSVVVEALFVSGVPMTRLLSVDVPAVLGTTYGMAMLVRVGLVAVLALLARWGSPARRVAPGDSGSGTAAPWAFRVAAGLLIGIAMTYSLSGHPIASAIPVLAVASDMIHVLAMSVWLGGLVVLVVALLPEREAGLLGEVLPRYSTVALISIAALLVSGIVQAFLEISPLAALWSTSYGLLVTLKVIGFAVIVWLGNLARTWVGARYAAEDRGNPAAHSFDTAQSTSEKAVDPTKETAVVRRSPVLPGDARVGGLAVTERHRTGPPHTTFEVFRRRLLLELGVAATVLALAAVLVATIPARSAYAAPFAGSLALPDGASVELTVEPARSGLNLMHIYLVDETGQPMDVQGVSVTAELPAQEIGPLDVPLQPTGPGHYTAAGFALPVAGLWAITIHLRFGEFDAASVTAQVPVS
jgi:copper transport protein